MTVRRLASTVATSVVAVLAMTGCGGSSAAPDTSAPSNSAGSTATTAPSPAQQGRTASSQQVTFVPQSLRLPSGDVVAVTPAVTTKGALEVPNAADTSGWWDGSAQAGEAFGATVIAGHVDTAAVGLAPFAQLLKARVGDEVWLQGSGRRLGYRVTKVDTVDKDVLATSSDALSQSGSHRLSLITCTGTWDPATRHYDSNLVVTAVPLGPTTSSPKKT